MDPALPPGGLQRIFQQYDAIRSHATRDDGPPPWMPEEDKPDAPTLGQPSRQKQGDGASNAQTQAVGGTPGKEPDAPPLEQPSRQKRGGSSSNEPPLRTKERVELANRSTQQVLSDATQARPLGKPWSEDRAQRAAELMEQNLQRSRQKIDQQNEMVDERLHQAQDKKYYETMLKNPQGATFKQDEEGMNAAYGYRSYPGAAYDENTQTLYVAGSDSWRSWYDDFRNIPAWGDLKDSERYKQAERAYEDLTRNQGKYVRRVVGHSLGGSVALELAKNKGIEVSRTFGAPVLDPNPFHRGNVERLRHPLDPVSVLDRGASWGSVMAYPHSYTGFQAFDEPAPYIFDVGQKTKRQQQSLTA